MAEEETMDREQGERKKAALMNKLIKKRETGRKKTKLRAAALLANQLFLAWLPGFFVYLPCAPGV